MSTTVAAIAPIVTIFVRHSVDCRHRGDEFTRRCKCRKHLRWTQNGTQHRRQAGTRSWEEAERAKRRFEDQLAGRTVSLPKVVVDEVPTLPLSDEEYEKLLDALYATNPRRWDGKLSTQGLTPKMQQRLRALFQLMRLVQIGDPRRLDIGESRNTP